MIAGETENIIGLETGDSFYKYDELFGLGGKRKKQKTKRALARTGRSQEEIAVRKEKRKNFWSGLGNTFKDNGGLEGVTSSLGNVFNIFRKNPAPDEPTDYRFGLGGSTAQQESKKVPTGIYVVGGAVVIGLVIWGVTHYRGRKMQKGKEVTPNPTQ
ncbi:hypothetical protein QQ008_07675 [Fulvivirgaceae bacterium BMA10]|uniref:Uncharacterized protein n=1 Tax=Splendidivirga corallicola TaxID=3051826 RepID=A0ABT8KKJ3_9BACT|nr:hypothetical protein [Fulvivirgaceae bacterium BMA10]